jgi:hypothetical protein
LSDDAFARFPREWKLPLIIRTQGEYNYRLKPAPSILPTTNPEDETPDSSNGVRLTVDQFRGTGQNADVKLERKSFHRHSIVVQLSRVNGRLLWRFPACEHVVDQ